MKNKKPRNAWMLFLSSNDYYVYMVLNVYKNLIDTKTRYPVYCAVTEDVSEETRQILTKVGLKILPLYAKWINKYSFKLTDLTWYNKALAKLSLLSTEVEKNFDKIVYLDSDLWIKSNIDELFKKPHMSAVINRSPDKLINTFYAGQSIFCSGLFVWDFKENPHIGHKLLLTLSDLPKNVEWHDQAILNYWYSNWKDLSELHLDYHYGLMNCFDIEKYSDAKVIHFVSRNRTNWPFETKTVVPEWYYSFKKWIKVINESLDFFSNKYRLHFPQLHYENISYKQK